MLSQLQESDFHWAQEVVRRFDQKAPKFQILKNRQLVLLEHVLGVALELPNMQLHLCGGQVPRLLGVAGYNRLNIDIDLTCSGDRESYERFKERLKQEGFKKLIAARSGEVGFELFLSGRTYFDQIVEIGFLEKHDSGGYTQAPRSMVPPRIFYPPSAVSSIRSVDFRGRKLNLFPLEYGYLTKVSMLQRDGPRGIARKDLYDIIVLAQSGALDEGLISQMQQEVITEGFMLAQPVEYFSSLREAVIEEINQHTQRKVRYQR